MPTNVDLAHLAGKAKIVQMTSTIAPAVPAITAQFALTQARTRTLAPALPTAAGTNARTGMNVLRHPVTTTLSATIRWMARCSIAKSTSSPQEPPHRIRILLTRAKSTAHAPAVTSTTAGTARWTSEHLCPSMPGVGTTTRALCVMTP